jgi:hypothetical protein
MREGSAKALWNLSYISDNRAAVAEAGGVKLLVDMLRSDDKDKHAAARALWNLAYSEPNRQLISSAGGVRPLVALLKSDNVKVTPLLLTVSTPHFLRSVFRGMNRTAGAAFCLK